MKKVFQQVIIIISLVVVLVSLTKDIKMQFDVSFTLTQTDLAKSQKASAVMQLFILLLQLKQVATSF